MQDYEYDDQKTKAIMATYERNFQTVSNKLMETKLEEVEAMKSIQSPEPTIERGNTNIVQSEGTSHEQVLTVDTVLVTNDNAEVSRGIAIPGLQEMEPCTPLTDMPEESCDDLKNRAISQVKRSACIKTTVIRTNC